jgi:hypothetical protein
MEYRKEEIMDIVVKMSKDELIELIRTTILGMGNDIGVEVQVEDDEVIVDFSKNMTVVYNKLKEEEEK